MSRSPRPFCSVVMHCVLVALLFSVSFVKADDVINSDPAALLRRAQQFTTEKPTASHILGTLRLAAMTSKHAATIDEAKLLALLPANDPQSATVRQWLCYRMLPVGYGARERFRQRIEALKDDHTGAASLLRLYLAMLDRDRDTMLALTATRGSAMSLSAAADQAAFDVLLALGVSKDDAALHVISHRQFDALHGLSDLDVGLSREILHLRSIDRAADADKLAAWREQLRSDYLTSSKHIVERLFALNLLGKATDRDALLARQTTFNDRLTQRGGLASIIHLINPLDRWSQLLEPMLASDLAVLDQPPRWLTESADLATSLRIEATKRNAQGDTTHYTGDVILTLGDLRITCDQMTVTRATATSISATGLGNLTLHTASSTATAQRFTLTTSPMAIALLDNVKVKWRSRSAAGTNFSQATFSLGGEFITGRTFLDDWKEAKDLDAKFALLARIHIDDEPALPDEAKFLRALRLIEPHLSWHAPFAPPHESEKVKIERQSRLEQKQDESDENDWRWSEALGREPWMRVPQHVIDQCKAILAKAPIEKANPPGPSPRNPADLCFWRLKNTQHAEVARAIALLEAVRETTIAARAQRWATELKRNNTVITFDIAGGFATGLDGPMAMDVRSAEEVTFKLYRVRQSADLLRVAQQVGTDFIFRDHALHIEDPGLRLKRFEAMMEHVKMLAREEQLPPLPLLAADDVVASWSVRVADLPHLNLETGEEFWEEELHHENVDDPNSRYGDRNDEHAARLSKEYRPHRNEASSWRTDRLVKIPAKAVEKAGGYILVASADGAVVHVPILVEPLSITLRRSRDGVFVMAADASGRFPVVGAEITAPQALRSETTDRRGVTFLRVHAAGSRPILAHKDGRYALGGFGRVFDGVYRRSFDDFDLPDMQLRAIKLRLERLDSQTLAQVYDDRFVIAAYTDRPTYRPGQRVLFKVIIRELAPDGARNENGKPAFFRAEDFDFASRLIVPKASEPALWEVINPQGRVVATGSAKLNDFGTAAGEAELSSESSVGNYALRWTVSGMAHVVPDVFAVKHYRRPNVELKVEGVPTLVTKPGTLPLKFAANFYFGPPVTQGTIDTRLVRAEQWKPLVQMTATLDASGHAESQLDLPRQLPSGMYAVISTLTDASGRSVTNSQPLEYRGNGAIAGTSNLPALPRFVAVGQDLIVRTPRGEVTATVSEGAANVDQVFLAKDGAATIKLSRAGWHRIQTGEEHVDVFAYGSEESAIATLPPLENVDPAGRDSESRWANLTDFNLEEQRGFNRLDDPRFHLHAMFERHHALVGDTLRVLIYCPVNQPRILLTIEGRTVIDYIDVTVEAKAGRYHVIEIPIKKHYGPNFYLQGRILGWGETAAQPRRERSERKQRELEAQEEAEDESRDPRWCRVDVIDPQRKTSGEQLNVQIETDGQTFKPGEEVGVRIHVTDLAGQPREAELSLAAVDESIFTFGEETIGSLAATLGSPIVERRYEPKAWRSSVGSRWSKQEIEREAATLLPHRQELMQKAMEAAKQSLARSNIEQSLEAVEGRSLERPVPLASLAGKLPVTAIELMHVRKDFRETATWQPQIRTDASGRAVTTLKLPDSLTAYRLTAVGVTKSTEIGSGRSMLRASLPLSVQVFLPRFAIEKDELEATALIHNSEAKPKTCTIRWEIAGASSAAIDGTWKRTEAQATTVYEREIEVPSRGSMPVALKLIFDRAGEVRVNCKVVERDQAANADGEERTVRVSPLGRPMEQLFSGTFEGEHRIRLAPGFVASDIQITLSRQDVAHALDGLGYLVEYPHGCVEQTMSRFLPAVMVRHAAKKSAIQLPAEIEAKMPDVLAKGLERIYSFQHADGSFGWFARDARDDAMTVYVLYGLARCKATGTKVDENILNRGCDYLKARLSAKSMSENDAARARLVLALAGQSSVPDLESAVDAVLVSAATSPKLVNHQAMANLSLACLEAGQRELASRLWKHARAWDAKTTADLALKLIAQSAFNDSVQSCNATASLLLSQRQGHRWAHTRDTSWAIEALTELVSYAPPVKGSAGLIVEVGGKRVFEIGKDDPRAAAVERVSLLGDQCPKEAGAEIVLRTDGKGPMHFAVTAKGVERLDHALPRGDAVKVSRQFELLDGKPVEGAIKIGQVIAVRLNVELAEDQSHVILEDARPAGLEFAGDQLRILRGSATASAVEFRDDRLCVFFSSLKAGRHEFVYYLRAESVGISHVLPGVAYPMYSETLRGETGTRRLIVVR